MSDGYTVLVQNPPVVNASYDSIANLWSSPFYNYDDPGWDPYLDFGDISSLTYNGSDIYDPFFNLWHDSCWDGDIQNCTSVCSNATLLFANVSSTSSSSKQSEPRLNTRVPYNIMACMYYPVLSKLLSTQLPKNDSWEQLVAIGKQYNIVANASVDLIQVMVDTQVSCYQDYCWSQSEDFCINFDLDTGNYQAMTGEGVLPYFPDWSTISPDSSMNINTDIGGIGVSIAYIVEFGILIITWLALRYLGFSQYLRIKRSPGQARGEGAHFAWAAAPVHYRSPSKETVSKMAARMRVDLTQFLIQFHQAQCWFFIPLNLTVLLGLIGSTQVFGTTSLGQLARNMAFAQCVTQGGIVFTVAAMYFIMFEDYFSNDKYEVETENVATGKTTVSSTQMLDATRQAIHDPKQMFLLWILTFIAVSLGTAAWLLSFQISKPAHLIDAAIGSFHVDWTATCGSVSPATYNGELWNDQYTHKNNIKKRLPIIIFCWILLAGMLFYFYRTALVRLYRKARPSNMISKQLSSFQANRWIRRVILGLVEMAVLTCLGFFLNDYLTLMRPDLPQIDKTFTMGQLLATFVWAGAIVNLFFVIWEWISAGSPMASRVKSGSVGYRPVGDDGSQIKLVRMQSQEPR